MRSSEVLSAEARARVIEIAQASVHAAAHGKSYAVDVPSERDELRALRATFTTLRAPDGSLRGCTGVVEAYRPLAEDVASTARGAALHDPRFPRLTPTELEGLDVSVSVLTPMQSLEVASEDELLEVIRPGVDGVMLTDGSRRGLFLPSVWESLPDPKQFVAHLKRKASLDVWTPTTRAHRFQVEKITP